MSSSDGDNSKRGSGLLLGLLHFFFPGTGLALDQVYSHCNFLRLPGVDHPDHLAAGFLVADLHPDYVSRLQRSLQAGELGAMMADIPGLGILQEWTTIRTHAKHSDRQLYIQSGLWFVRHEGRRCSAKQTASI